MMLGFDRKELKMSNNLYNNGTILLLNRNSKIMRNKFIVWKKRRDSVTYKLFNNRRSINLNGSIERSLQGCIYAWNLDFQYVYHR